MLVSSNIIISNTFKKSLINTCTSPEIVTMLIILVGPSLRTCARYASKMMRKHTQDNFYFTNTSFLYGLNKM